MKIVSVGGGPAGLYFAILMKQVDSSHEIEIHERNGPDDTFGWGVVFSDETLGHFADADRSSYQSITDSFASGDLNQLLSDAHDQTGLTAAQSLYGFTGSGQTVAVIDTGIAYDHSAFGGGLGADYQVVGGWDFSNENDADPYDDGFAGSHGTHVAGIIGSNDATNPGVAPGVDLVALRVFNDFGAGYFEWVEDALQWVHENRDAFANPITAVNLSLGGSWNSDKLPEWAILEDEFAQLEQDGIFISVAVKVRHIHVFRIRVRAT